MKSDANSYDAIVVGGGPAGTSAAITLRMRGAARVLLVEAKKFPRPKLCGEFISPECLKHFACLGVKPEIDKRGGQWLEQTVFYARSGRSIAVPSVWFGSTAALGLSRAAMDDALLHRARETGVEVLEQAQASSLIVEENAVRGVQIKIGNEVARDFRAAVTLDATGRSRALARRITVTAVPQADASRRRAALVAFKVHLEDARTNDRCCEIYFYKGGYGGLSNVEGNRSNLCFIVSASDVREHRGAAEQMMREIVMSNRRAAASLRRARPCSPWLCVALEGFGRQEVAPLPGLLAVGDAASFIDPFTGSGMLMALESGELAATTVAEWLLRRRASSQQEAPLASLESVYADRYAAKFAARLRVCAVLRRAAFAPQLAIESLISALNLNAVACQRLARATRRPSAASLPT